MKIRHKDWAMLSQNRGDESAPEIESNSIINLGLLQNINLDQKSKLARSFGMPINQNARQQDLKQKTQEQTSSQEQLLAA